MLHPAIKASIQAGREELVSIRRKLHSEPELPWEEEKTTEFVVTSLKNSAFPSGG